MTTTTVHAPVELSRRRLTGLFAAVIAATAAVTSTLTNTAVATTDESAHTAAASQYSAKPVDDPFVNPSTAAADQIIAAEAKPIVVADAYHGVGFEMCPDGTAPVKVADAYHGVGFSVCR
jgi:hypothetical protein